MSVEPAAKIDAEAQRWVVRLDRGLTAEEQAALDSWLSGDGRRKGALVRAQAAWSLLDRARALAAAEGQVGREREAGPQAEHARWTRRRVGGLAACAALAIVAAAGLVWAPWSNGEAYATTTGEIRRLPLEDGSLAMINSGSEIRVAFKPDRREVELSYGEAWFKVAKNPQRPFTVAVGPVRVEAVGTAFDLRRRNGQAEVTVTEGVVKVWSTADRGEMFVRAGHRAVVGDEVGVKVVALSAADLDQQLAWQEGRIILDDMTLAAAAAEFNRYSEVKLEVAPALANQQMVGSFRFDDLDGFVDAAATLVGGRVERDGSVVRILR